MKNIPSYEAFAGGPLFESTYTDFVSRHGKDVSGLLSQLKKLGRALDSASESDYEKAVKAAYKACSPYDKDVVQSIEGWMTDRGASVDVVAREAVDNQNRHGTETRQVVFAMGDFVRALARELDVEVDESAISESWGRDSEYRDFKAGKPIKTELNGKKVSVQAAGQVKATALKKGMRLGCAYNSTNTGVEFVEILGLTDADDKYGESGKVKFDSVKDAMAHYKVGSLAALEKLDGHEDAPRLVCKDLGDNSTGAWYYLYKGRYVRGSGAEALTFYEFDEIENESASVDEGKTGALDQEQFDKLDAIRRAADNASEALENAAHGMDQRDWKSRVDKIVKELNALGFDANSALRNN